MADSSSAASFPDPHHSSPHPLPLDHQIPAGPVSPPELQWIFELPEPPFPAISQPEPPGGSANPAPTTLCSSMAASPSLCNASCLLLREISHTNGLQIWKLQIHGGIGMVTHAVLEKLSSDFSAQPQYQTFDFCMENGRGVKQFLVGYFEDRKEEGYVVLEDPLWEFYDALSVGLGVGDFMDIDSFFELPLIDSGQSQLNEQDMLNNQNHAPPPPPPPPQGDDGNGSSSSSKKPQKIPLSAQRERTGKLKLKDFAGYLHLPIEEAARRMNICPTVMKKICRRDGLVRWPYRKIKSIQRKIAAKSKGLSGDDPDERRRAHLEILDLQQQLAALSQAFFG